MRSDMDHAVLPANYTMPAFTPSRRTSPTFGWYSFYRPTEGRRLSRPMWLVTYRNKVPPLESNPDTVTHPSINRAQRRLTSLIETNDVHYATPPPNTISSVILSLKLWPKSTTFQAVARYVHRSVLPWRKRQKNSGDRASVVRSCLEMATCVKHGTRG